MKHMADNHRLDLQFTVGDWVYVKLRPYRQTSVQPTYSKLSKKFYGPFQILDRISAVVYRLQLLDNSRIHNVFHVSLLKPHHNTIPTENQALPPFNFDNHPIVYPLHILDWKTDNIVDPPIQQALVQWHSLPLEDATWERWSELKAAYDLEDKVYFQTGGIDSSTSPTEPAMQVARTNDSTTTTQRTSCTHTRPAHLMDYV